jgi:glycosyltransferase involved in cell wall biosynthesis
MPFLTLQAYRLWFSKDVAQADCIMTNSQGTADRLRSMCGVETDLIVRPAVSKLFSIPNEYEIGNTLRALNIRRPYILGLGTFEPRKNLAMLVDAFSQLKAAGQLTNYSLLLIGASGWKTSSLVSTLKRRASDDIVHLGYVEDCHLPSLFCASAAFVFPSLYEGFGIPVLEALSCGARVVTSDIPELREATNGRGIYVRTDVGSIKTGIMQALASKTTSTASDLDLSWERQAEIFAEFINKQYRIMVGH